MNFKKIFSNFFTIENSSEYDFTLPDNYNNSNLPKLDNIGNDTSPKKIFSSIDVNLDYIKSKYNTLINSDIVIREFTLLARNRQYKAFLLFIEGMVDAELINNFILKPLMLRNIANSYTNEEDKIISEAKTNNITVRKIKKFNLIDYISSHLLPQNSVEENESFNKIITGINAGNCALFVDTLDIAFNIDVKGFKQRNIDSPKNEVVIKGPHEAFVENIRTNTSLIRRIINNENLIIQNVEIGKVTKTRCAICYVKTIANSDLVSEVEYRLNNLQVDSVLSSGELEQLIADSNDLGLPRALSTERPDTASRHLLQGRVIVIINGSPNALIVPATLIDFFSTPEDINLKPVFANFLKAIRFLAALITLLLPGIYVAITSFHQEIIPTELLFSVLSAREKVPFPVIVEILVMEISFELIREAGLRVPAAIGFTISIVGGLVIGEAAVSANIVSPILIIIVAITAISSSAIPDFSFGFHLRLFRFIFILLGFMAGFLGISLGIFVYISAITSTKSFGLSSTIPFAPYINSKENKYFLSPVWKRENRPSYLEPKSLKEQDNISMKWRF